MSGTVGNSGRCEIRARGARYATGLEATDVRARIQWQNGVDVHAAIIAKFGDADYVNFTSIRMHPRQEMTFHGDAGVLRLPVPFNPRVFGEARLELQRGTDTITERRPTVNHYELQVRQRRQRQRFHRR